MKLTSLRICLMVVLGAFMLQGCIKDSYTTTHTYTIATPIYESKATVRANIKGNASKPLQQTGKLYIFGNYIFLNEVDKGIHVIDNSNPAQPVNFAFIDIPGNRDLAVKGSFLYADMYGDLVVLDISNPRQVVLKSFLENVFPHRRYENGFVPDSTKVITGWITRDTTITYNGQVGAWWEKNMMVFDSRANSFSASAGPMSGQGGSMARFALAGSMLYTVGNYELKTFDLAQPAQPRYVTTTNVGMNIETIFPFADKLFIGSMTGMYIYDISSPASPQRLSAFNHVRSCDPVITDGRYAYVTLRSGTACLGFTNQLEVIDIADLAKPLLVKTYQLSNPHGLSKDGDLLFICDGRDGLKIYDAASVTDLKLRQHFKGLDTYDVIAWNNKALVVASDGLYQYDYSNPQSVRFLSKISIQK